MNRPFTHLPHRSSLPVKVAECLRQRLARGDWARVLPGETELARELQVGRNTIRAALAILEKDGLIRTASGKRREVVGKVSKVRQPLVKVAMMLLPAPWQTLLWMDALRSRLHGAGWQLQIVVEAAAFRRAPSAALESLVDRHPSAVWILYRSTVAMQRWFVKHRPDTVIAGSCHAGIVFPQVDIDFRATCRHAAARMLGLGHRRLAVLAPVAPLAGDEESLRGFREGAELQKFPVKESKASVIQALRQMLSKDERPTAMFFLNARHAATALTFLVGRGFAVPGQMSLVSRDHDPLLEHFVPEPARYERQPAAFAKKLAHLVTALGSGVPLKHTKHLIIPAFVRGEAVR